MPRKPSYVDVARDTLRLTEPELLELVGRAGLEDTAYPVYANTFPPAAYLGWSRVVHAQRLLLAGDQRRAVLDFGSGLGVMLPFLSQCYDEVTAFDLDLRPTQLMVDRLQLPNITMLKSMPESNGMFDAVVALDVLEHVDGIDAIYADLVERTNLGGRWIISGPTENWLYKAMRKLSRTTGEAHVRTVYDVFDDVPVQMVKREVLRLPFGSPVPLFLIAAFERVN